MTDIVSTCTKVGSMHLPLTAIWIEWTAVDTLSVAWIIKGTAKARVHIGQLVGPVDGWVGGKVWTNAVSPFVILSCQPCNIITVVSM